MSSLPSIQIRQQPARIGFDADIGTLEMRQPQAIVEQNTTPSQMELKQPKGELIIDQSKAWDALMIGSNATLMNHIYSQSKNIALQGIARIVENGNRMADIVNGGNPFAEIAMQEAFQDLELDYVSTPPSISNVEIDYQMNKPIINISKAEVHFDVQIQRPEINYNRGKMEVYLLQHAHVEIIPPQIDLKY